MAKSKVSLEVLPPGFRYVHVVVTSKEYDELMEIASQSLTETVDETFRERAGYRLKPWGLKTAKEKMEFMRNRVEDLVKN